MVNVAILTNILGKKNVVKRDKCCLKKTKKKKQQLVGLSLIY